MLIFKIEKSDEIRTYPFFRTPWSSYAKRSSQEEDYIDKRVNDRSDLTTLPQDSVWTRCKHHKTEKTTEKPDPGQNIH